MLKSLDQMRLGVLSPTRFQNAETYRRAVNLDRDIMATFESISSPVVSSMDLSHDGEFLLCGGNDGRWHIFKIPSRMETEDYEIGVVESRRNHHHAIITCQWYPTDNGIFTTCARDGNLHVWAVNDLSSPVETYGDSRGSQSFFIKHHVSPIEVNRMAAVCKESDLIVILDLRVGSEVQRLPGLSPRCGNRECHTFSEVRWNPGNSNILAVGSSLGSLSECDIRSTVEPLTTYKSPYTDGSTESYQGGLLKKAHNGHVLSVRYSSTGHYLFSFGDDGIVNRFDTHSGLNISSFGMNESLLNNKARAYASICVFGEYPSIVYVPCNRRINVIDMDRAEVVKSLRCIGTASQFVFDESLIQGYSGGKTIDLWAPYTKGQELRKLEMNEKKRRNMMIPLIDTSFMD